MTDEQVIKALPCLYGQEVMCKGCDFFLSKYPRCKEAVAKNALNLIKRQQAEIDRLEADREALINGQITLQKMYAEAIKKFAERLKYRIFTVFGTRHYEVELTTDGFDRIVKELTEEK